MRKHFLILMLLALLPLAGWAQTSITGGTVAATVGGEGTTKEYTGEAMAINLTSVTPDGSSTSITDGLNVDGITWKESSAPTAIPEAVEEVKKAGYYTIGVRASGYSGVAYFNFTVSKATLTITAGNKKGNSAITYGDAFPAQSAFSVTYTGLKNADNKKNAQQQYTNTPIDGIEHGTLVYNTNYVQWTSGVLAANNYYSIIPAGVTFDNYEVAFVNGDLEVKPKTLTAAMINNGQAIADRTYNGNDYTPTPAVKDNVNADLDMSGNYGLTYWSADKQTQLQAGETPKKLAAAGTYWAKYEAAGNYTANAAIWLQFKVTKANLVVYSNNVNNLTYNAAEQTVPATNFTYEGYVAADFVDAHNPQPAALKNANVTIKTVLKQNNAVVAGKLAGDYKIGFTAVENTTPAASEPTYVTLANDDVFKNYTVIPFEQGTLTIQKKALTVTMLNQSKKYGESNALENEGGVAITATNAATYMTIDGLQPTAAATDVITVYPNAVLSDIVEGKPTKVNADKTAFRIFDSNNLNATNVTASYEITVNKGNWTVNPGEMYIKPVNTGSTYGDDEAPLTVLVTGGSDEDQLAVKALVEAGNLEIAQTSTEATGKVSYPNVGEYTISIKSTVDYGTYGNDYTITPLTGTYTISKRELGKITALPQTVVANATELADNVPSAETVKIELKATDTTYELTDTDLRILYGELALSMKGGIADKSAGKSDNAGVVVGYKNTAFSNFSIADENFVAGKLSFVEYVASNITLDRTISNNTGTIKTVKTTIHNNNGKIVNVKFGTRVLEAQKWNSFVLPFEISCAKLSQALGYAIFNVADQAASDAQHARFKIFMGTIAANTPFLMKTSVEVDMKDIAAIQNCLIVENNAPSVDVDTDGTIKFKGVYEPTVMKSNNSWVVNDKWKSGIGEGGILPLASYLEYPTTNAPIITLEEPDGSTTEIVAISADGVAIAKDGWYTLNGMKLNAVPTEKGVYINNGKKVVIK